MSKVWLDAARRIDGLSIVCLVDLDLDQARSRAAEFGLDGADTGASLEAMVDRSRPDLVFDVVVPAARSPERRLIAAVTC
jgi:predicted dehydrogenase